MNSFLKKSAGLLALSCVAAVSVRSVEPGAEPGNPTADIEQKVDALLQKMTLEEKIGLCSGDHGKFRGIARFNIPDLVCTDGPRGPTNGKSTVFPAGVALGASWDPDLVRQAGQIIGNETRSRGAGMLLGPGINIQRDPLGGRFFEYYTEDPLLNAALATASVEGIQSERVAACLKHYVCNNREDNRNFYMSMVDPRTLNEIYFPAFKAAVQRGHVWAVMTSANGVNGDFVSDSKALLNDTLKGQWGFDGFVLTDWLQTRSTEKAALAGLDVSMPGGDHCGFGRPLLDAVNAGRVPPAVIDGIARRVLRVYARVGLLDGRNLKDGAQANTPAHQAVARRAAEEGIVLLKNADHLLPLDPAKLGSVLVIGPSADKPFCLPLMGGSSGVESPYEVTALAGLKNALGDKVKYLSSDDLGGFREIPADVASIDGQKGFKAQYYPQGRGQAAVTRMVPEVNFMWEMRSPDPSIAPEGFGAMFEAHIDPPVDGTYTLRVTVGGSVRVFTEDGGAPIMAADRAAGRPTATAVVQLKKSHPYFVQLRYQRQPGDAALRLEWETPQSSPDVWDKVDAAARAADAVVFVGGIDHSIDTEGRDRTDMNFPTAQETLLNRLAGLNKRTVVVLYNGSPLEIGGWLPNVPAVVEAWYPGMEGGNAVADVLLGKANPSGRLPFTWPKKLADSPSHAIGTETHDRVDYKEGVMVGYRYFDSRHVEPQFPFGYGLSYTTFSFGATTLQANQGTVTGHLAVTNTGSRDGEETVQIYVRPLHPAVERPVHELKAFQKVALKAGQSQPVNFTLGPEAFSYFDAAKGQWSFDPGEYEIQVGASSEDIQSKATLNVADLVK